MIKSYSAKEKRENLRVLSDFLYTNREKVNHAFDMAVFFNTDTILKSSNVNKPTRKQLADLANANECGASACAVGWCATVIPPIDEDFLMGHLMYQRYWPRVLLYEDEVCPINEMFTFLFDSEWVYVDDSAEGAAFRIALALDNGMDLEKTSRALGCADYDELNEGLRDGEPHFIEAYKAERDRWLKLKGAE